MKKIGGVLLILFALLILSTATVFAQQTSGNTRDPVFEQQVYDRLAKINPDAVQVFKDATADMDGNDTTSAKAGFLKVLELAPGFPDALRRLSSVELAQEDYQNAEIHARQALAADPNANNQAAVAAALTGSDDSTKLKESLSLAQAAQQSEPDDVYFNFILLLAAAKNKDMDTIRLASNQMIKLAPGLDVGHYYAGIIAYTDKDPARAESELLLAEQYGFPKDTIEKIMSDYNIHTQAFIQRSLIWSGFGLVGWLAGLLLLLLVGWVLSSLTLRTVNRQVAGTAPLAQPAELSIRGLYRVVISIAAGYFYFSIPFLIVLVVALVSGIIYLFFAIGTIPIYLALFIVCAGLVTIYALIRSVFARGSKGDPGRKVEQNEMPELWQLTREVAAKVGTRPVDSIFLTPGVEVGVLQRGSLIHQLQDRGERVLILGMASLNDLSQGQLRAILAHEYGHFTNRDTDSSTITRQVQISVHNMAVTLAANGIARWYNPVWWFITGYYRIFMRITLGASRLQEMLADRVAAMSYGTRTLTTGLQTFFRSSLEFRLKIDAEVEEAKAAGRHLNNLYALPNLMDPGPLEKKLAEVMSHPPSPYDSHPAPRQRLALIERIPASGYFDEDPRPAWDLIPDAGKIQEEVTAQIDAQIRR